MPNPLKAICNACGHRWTFTYWRKRKGVHEFLDFPECEACQSEDIDWEES